MNAVLTPAAARPARSKGVSEAEWRTRCDLVARYRLAALHAHRRSPQRRRGRHGLGPAAAVGRATRSSNQMTLYLTPMHAEAGLIKSMIANVDAAIRHVKAAAEQLPKIDRWRVLLACICQRIDGHIGLPIPPPTFAAPGQLRLLG
jgi:hypothetical protein